MDSLSDLAGAPEFDALLAREELKRSRTGERLAVAVVDLDGLRSMNSRQGWAAGSRALSLCADALLDSLRAVDEPARTGPDEFSVLLHATDAAQAVAWADRFEDALEATAAEHPAAPLTCAVGLADTSEEPSLMQVAVRAHRRMEVVQTVRKLKRARESGGS